MDCLFCKIIAGEIPCYKVFENEYVLAFLDIEPKAMGHTLIIPKKHFKDLDDIDENTLIEIFNAAKTIKKVLEEKLNCSGLSLIQNNGDLQEVKHFHLHLIPNYQENNEKTLEEIKAILGLQSFFHFLVVNR